MEHLPPVGWADVATKQDLDHLSTVLRSEMKVLRSDIARVRSDLAGQTHTMMSRLLLQILAAQFAFVTVVLVVSGVT